MRKVTVEIDIDKLPSRAEVIEWAEQHFLTDKQRYLYEQLNDEGKSKAQLCKEQGWGSVSNSTYYAANDKMEIALEFADIVNPLHLYNNKKVKKGQKRGE